MWSLVILPTFATGVGYTSPLKWPTRRCLGSARLRLFVAQRLYGVGLL